MPQICHIPEEEKLTLLRQKQSISLLQRNPMSGVLVIWREARRVCRLGDLARDDLLEGIDPLAGAVDGVHEMHGCGLWIELVGWVVCDCSAVQVD